MTALLFVAPATTEEKAPPAEACSGRWRDSTRSWHPCEEPVTYEALRVCHDITQRDPLCTGHAKKLGSRDTSGCRTCKASVAQLVALMPIRGGC